MRIRLTTGEAVICAVLVFGMAAPFIQFAKRAAAETPPDFNRITLQSFEPASAPLSARAHSNMIDIPADVYPIGEDQGERDRRPRHEVALEAFRIDRTEVTNGAFAEFLNALDVEINSDFAAGGLRRRTFRGRGFDLLSEGREGSGRYAIIALDDDQALIGARRGRFVPKPGYEDHPVTETTWAGARAYCQWRGARLPTEVEWEAAARGPDGRRYPWGNAAPTGDLVYTSGRTGVTAPVGSRPAGRSPFGGLDMSGSLAEWTNTLKRPYPYDGDDGREAPRAAGERVTRGGDYVFDTSGERLTATHRNGFSNAPGRGHRHIGFRCAASGHGS